MSYSNASVGAPIDAGLRVYMLRVYSYMAGGLALTGIVANATASSGFYQTIAGTPLIWIVMLAPLGFVLALSFGIQRMSAGTATALFWIYAAVMGLSLGSIFLVFTAIRLGNGLPFRSRPFADIPQITSDSRMRLSRFSPYGKVEGQELGLAKYVGEQ